MHIVAMYYKSIMYIYRPKWGCRSRARALDIKRVLPIEERYIAAALETRSAPKVKLSPTRDIKV